jgi:hypothetical protein
MTHNDSRPEHRAVMRARRALMRSLEKRYPPRLANALTCLAVSGAEFLALLSFGVCSPVQTGDAAGGN